MHWWITKITKLLFNKSHDNNRNLYCFIWIFNTQFINNIWGCRHMWAFNNLEILPKLFCLHPPPLCAVTVHVWWRSCRPACWVRAVTAGRGAAWPGHGGSAPAGHCTAASGSPPCCWTPARRTATVLDWKQDNYMFVHPFISSS